MLNNNIEIIKNGEYEIIINNNSEMNVLEPIVKTIVQCFTIIIKNLFD